MTEGSMIAPDLSAIPDFLTGLPRWVAWRSESRGGKQTKVPKTPRNTNAASTRPDTWTSFDVIRNELQRDAHRVSFLSCADIAPPPREKHKILKILR
jgi:hypothetical protein